MKIALVGYGKMGHMLEQTALALKNRDANKAIAIVHQYNEELLARLEMSEKLEHTTGTKM